MRELAAQESVSNRNAQNELQAFPIPAASQSKVTGTAGD